MVSKYVFPLRPFLNFEFSCSISLANRFFSEQHDVQEKYEPRQGHIQDPIRHLGWSFLVEIVKGF